MTVQLLPSEFPYIWGKFYFIFYQCTNNNSPSYELTNDKRYFSQRLSHHALCQLFPVNNSNNVKPQNRPMGARSSHLTSCSMLNLSARTENRPMGAELSSHLMLRVELVGEDRKSTNGSWTLISPHAPCWTCRRWQKIDQWELSSRLTSCSMLNLSAKTEQDCS